MQTMTKPVLTRAGATEDDHYKANVVLNTWARWVVGILALAALGFGAYLAWDKADGVATAAVFAVALLCGVVSIGGVLPSSVKVGDVSIEIEKARQEGKEEGKEEGKVLGVHDAAFVAAHPDKMDEIVATAPPGREKSFKEGLKIVRDAAITDPAEWQRSEHDLTQI